MNEAEVWFSAYRVALGAMLPEVIRAARSANVSNAGPVNARLVELAREFARAVADDAVKDFRARWNGDADCTCNASGGVHALGCPVITRVSVT